MLGLRANACPLDEYKSFLENQDKPSAHETERPKPKAAADRRPACGGYLLLSDLQDPDLRS